MIPRSITGLGIVCVAGIGRQAFFEAMAAPELLCAKGPAPSVTFDSSAYPDAALAEVANFEPKKYLGEKGLRTLDRLTKLLVVTARLAMHDAGYKKDNAYVAMTAEAVGLCTANAYGSLEAITEMDRVATLEDARYINPAKFPNTVANSPAGYVSIWEDIRALNVSVSDGNCGALDAVACADLFLETGRADAMLVGGAESMSEPLYVAFHRLGALDSRTRLGEGAVLMAVESRDHAVGRGAEILGDIVGYGTSFVAPPGEAPLIFPSPVAITRAIHAALADASLSPADVDLVASGVSGLDPFDDAELLGIREALGPDVPVAAPKAIVGETLGASGGMAMASVLAWFQGAPVTPVVAGDGSRITGAGAAARPIRTVVVTSLGFYGNASAVVLRSVTQERP